MILFIMPWKKDGVEVVCKTVRMDDPKLVERLYDAGTSMAAVAPEKQSVFLALLRGMLFLLRFSYCLDAGSARK